jgi:YidC/Oxa1 family membrane protein insertase
MERRKILSMVLLVILYYTWVMIKQPFAIPEEAAVDVADTEEAVANQALEDSVVPTAGTERVPAVQTDSQLPVRELPFTHCGVEGSWTTDGGGLRSLKLVDHQAPYTVMPLYSYVLGWVTGSVEGPWNPYGEEPGRVELLSDQALAFSPGSGDGNAAPVRMEVISESPLVLRGRTADGLVVEQRVTSGGEPCVVELKTRWLNQTGEVFDGDLWIATHDILPEGAGGMMARYMSFKQGRAVVDGSLEYSPEEIEEPTEVEGPVSWLGLADRYFAIFGVPRTEGGDGRLVWTRRGELQGSHYRVAKSLVPGADYTERMDIYVGPMDLDIMGVVDPTLEQAVDLGWFAFFAKPLLFLLKIFHAGTNNWGVSIMLLTLLVKLIFFPMTQTQFKSSQAMAALQPEIKKIREEFKDNSEELNRRTMELFKENKVNPLAGCLPMLIQFPVWIALYNVLLSSVELYHTDFLYLRDLSEADPYCVLPAIVVVLMMIQQQFTPTGNMDPAQARMMKLMPLVFGVLFFTFPSGLVVYIFVNMALSIGQQWVIRRTFNASDTAPSTT